MIKDVLKLNKFLVNSLKITSTMGKGKDLQAVVEILEKFAPLNLAESWDNVGLLIEPHKKRPIKTILLTNDLTESVMGEAVDRGTDLIISYHPPIFAALKRITQSHWKERIVAACLTESIALYSPHTAWDTVSGGVNDWLASALPYIDIKPIHPNPNATEGDVSTGSGRIFQTKIILGQAIDFIQKHINLDVHVAPATNHTLETEILTVALCAGSGGSLLKGLTVDLFITGEMSHHEVLDANHRGTSIILCNHSNSERGFLKAFKGKLHELLHGDCEVITSERDVDPLSTFVLKH